ncbi:MAG: ABC transporter ATP-binding protein, partial [Caldilineaceae bacterium]|nr:ABC transporter ATP-binding protein [Caldilineaceae bacterium]
MGFGREGFERAANLDNESAGDVGETLRRLVGYLLPHRYALSMSMVSMVLSAVALAVSPFIVAYTIDNYILTGDVNGLIRMLLVLLGAFAMQYLGFRGQFYYVGIMGQEVMARIRSEIFVKVQKLSLSYFDKHDAGDLMSRLVNDVDVLNQFLSQGFVQFIGGIVRMIFVAVAMFLVDWRLALATLIVVPMMILVSTYLSRLARKAFRESRESLGDVSTELEEGISGVKVAQAFNRSEENVRHFQELNRRNRDANVGAVGVSSAFMPAMEVLNALATTIVAGYGGYQAISGAISVGVVVGFLEYVRRFFFPVQQIAQLWVLVQSSLAGAERIFHLLDEEVSLTDAPGAQPMPEIQGRIVFDNVQFEYDEGEPILRGISLTAEPGQT